MRAQDDPVPEEVAVESDRPGQAGVTLQVLDQGGHRRVARLDQRLDDPRLAQAHAPRLARLAGRDLVEVGDQRRHRRLPPGGRRRSLRLEGPPLLVGQEVGELVEEGDERRRGAVGVARPRGPVEAHALGLGLGRFLKSREPAGVEQGQGVVAAHLGADGAVEVVPGEVVGQGDVGDVVGRELALGASPARPGEPDGLGQVGPAQAEQQANLDRVQAGGRDRRRLVVCAEAAEARVAPAGWAGPLLAGGQGHPAQGRDIRRRVSLLADGGDGVDQAVPCDGEPGFLPFGRRENPSPGPAQAAAARPDVAEADLDLAIVAPSGVGQALLEQHDRGPSQERGQGRGRGLPGVALAGRGGDRRPFEPGALGRFGPLPGHAGPGRGEQGQRHRGQDGGADDRPGGGSHGGFLAKGGPAASATGGRPPIRRAGPARIITRPSVVREPPKARDHARRPASRISFAVAS